MVSDLALMGNIQVILTVAEILSLKRDIWFTTISGNLAFITLTHGDF